MRASRAGIPAAFGAQNEDPNQGWGSLQEEILKKVILTDQWKRYSHTFIPKYPFLFVLAGPTWAREETVAVDVDAIQLEKGTESHGFRAARRTRNRRCPLGARGGVHHRRTRGPEDHRV